MAKVIDFKAGIQAEEMKDINDWTFEDFLATFKACKEAWGEDAAVNVIHQIWRIRAGEEA